MARRFCKHYWGMHGHDSCEAGVVFATLDDYGTKKFRSTCPCFGSDHQGRCDKKEYPTLEEMAAEEAEIAERLKNIAKARLAIVEHCGGPWREGMEGTSGVIDCPVCGVAKSLKFSRAGLNGHIHAFCKKTVTCVSWTE